MTGRASRWRGRLLALGLGLLPLLAAELGLRWWIGAQVYTDGATGQDLIFGHGEGVDDLVLYTPDPDLLWRYRRGVRVTFPGYTIETTRAGFRATPHTEDAGTPLRVVTLGDSRTMGAGVEAGETFAAQLETLLEPRLARSVDVIDLGVDGYSTFHGVQLGALELPTLRPDVVIAAFDVNDASYDCSWDHATRARHVVRWRVVLHDRLNRSALFLGVRRFARSFASYEPDPGDGTVVLNVGPEDYAANIRLMSEQASEGGWTLVVARIPLGTHLGHAEPDEFAGDVARYAEVARNTCEDAGIPWADTGLALAKVPRDEGWVEMIHPAAAGHRAIASTLAEVVAGLVLGKSR